MPLFAPDDPRPIHFVGIGGAGMSALALLAGSRGVTVTGCDLNPDAAHDVAETGVSVLRGHDASHVSGVRGVVYSSAIPPEHEELRTARDAGLPVVRRAEALGMAVAGGFTIGVAGTHGKTTTTAMIATALAATGEDPTAIAGGRVSEWNGNARIGSQQLFVVEADEYDRSFLALEPDVAVVTNMESEHLDCYDGSMEVLEQAFVEFAGRAKRVIVGADDRGASRVGRRLDVPVWRVGTPRNSDLRLADVRTDTNSTAAALTLPDGQVVQIELALPGLHNLRNAAAALGVVLALEKNVKAAAAGLKSFAGVCRRFELVGTERGVTVIDDYAHHPTEVAVTLAAARQRYPSARVVAVFQPHLYSRTRLHGAALGIVLSTADLVIVTDVYPAREQPIPGVTGQLVAKAAKKAGAAVEWVSERENLAAQITDLVREGDVVLTLGAGDITDVGPELLRNLTGAAA